MAEPAVKTLKRLFKDPYLAVLDHRNTPSQGMKASPAQRLFSGRSRTVVPMHSTLLQPKVVYTQKGLVENRKHQAAYYNRHAEDLNTLH